METKQVSVSCPDQGLTLIFNDTLPTELFPLHPAGSGPSSEPIRDAFSEMELSDLPAFPPGFVWFTHFCPAEAGDAHAFPEMYVS